MGAQCIEFAEPDRALTLSARSQAMTRSAPCPIRRILLLAVAATALANGILAQDPDGAKLRKAGDLQMLQLITRFDGKKGTRLTWMHHGIGHEEYHRGQIALCARLVGATPALTKRIYGE